MSTYPGNTGNPATVADQAVKVRDRFGLSRVVLVADREMLTNSQIRNLEEYPGIGWITAMKTFHLRGLVKSGHIQMSLFDEKVLQRSVHLLIPPASCYCWQFVDDRCLKENPQYLHLPES